MQTAKYAVLIYPNFSLQEITCLTSCLTVWFGEKLDIIASERKEYVSEEGFCVMPAKTVVALAPPFSPAKSTSAQAVPSG